MGSFVVVWYIFGDDGKLWMSFDVFFCADGKSYDVFSMTMESSGRQVTYFQ